MNTDLRPSLFQTLQERRKTLTPKGRILCEYVLSHPRKVIFMTTRELAEACGVSEATVVRFVGRLGCEGYGAFLQALRDTVDTELTLMDRVDLTDLVQPESERWGRVVMEEIENLRHLYDSVDMAAMDRVVTMLREAPEVYVVGSRLSYTAAYYLGWCLTKVRKGVRILRGSDRTSIDWLTIAGEDVLVVLFATSRYPNELIRIGRLVRRLGLALVLITDSAACPLMQFAGQTLVAPSRSIPLFGSPTSLSCLINYLVQELASRLGEEMKHHQERLEQMYLENDVLFNLKRERPGRDPV
ncbi:MAG TPA: MurR/RpiR family transcriptional regulator [Desulfobacterales bacterium]